MEIKEGQGIQIYVRYNEVSLYLASFPYNYLPNQWIVLFAHSDWLLKLGIMFVFRDGSAKVVSKMENFSSKRGHCP